MRGSLHRLTMEPSSFRGMLSIFNEIYLPLALPFFQNVFPILRNNPPDLLILDIGTLGALDIAVKLNVSYLVNSPTLLFDLEVCLLSFC